MSYDSIYIVTYCPYRLILYPLFGHLFLFMFYFNSFSSFLIRELGAFSTVFYLCMHFTIEQWRERGGFFSSFLLFFSSLLLFFPFLHVKRRAVEHLGRDGVKTVVRGKGLWSASGEFGWTTYGIQSGNKIRGSCLHGWVELINWLAKVQGMGYIKHGWKRGLGL